MGEGPVGDQAMKPSNHLVWAILVTIFCCLPFGIVAIVYAAQVDGKWSSGDHAGAINSANQAKFWCWLGFGIGVAVTVIVIIAQIAIIGTAASQM